MVEQRIGVGRLAQLTGISERLIFKYRSGAVEPRDSFGDPTENAHKIAAALGVPIDSLMPPRTNGAPQEAVEDTGGGNDELAAA